MENNYNNVSLDGNNYLNKRAGKYDIYNTKFIQGNLNPYSKSTNGLHLGESQFFKPMKDKTHAFFKNSKIGSCSHVLVQNGQALAVQFNIKNSKGKSLNHYKTIPTKSSELMSIYRKDYSIKPNMHCGMEKKPLEPYNPGSYRNRLPNTDYVISHKNKSSFEIGNREKMSRKQWTSTSKDYFQTPVFLPISNTGILSDNAIKIHKKLVSL